MGSHIMFHREGDQVGMAYFSAFTQNRQAKMYGRDWLDCLTYSDPEAGEETLGPRGPGTDDENPWNELALPWAPDWIRGLARAESLWAQIEESKFEYDLLRFPEFLRLMRLAAEEPSLFTVSISC